MPIGWYLTHCFVVEKIDMIVNQNQMVHYKKDGTSVNVLVTTMPIIGGLKTEAITHYCSLMSPISGGNVA